MFIYFIGTQNVGLDKGPRRLGLAATYLHLLKEKNMLFL